MRRAVSVSLLAVLLFAVPLIADDKEEVPVVEEPGSCNYCSKSQCGCAAAPLGFVLRYSCACGTHTCTRDCVYERI